MTGFLAVFLQRESPGFVLTFDTFYTQILSPHIYTNNLYILIFQSEIYMKMGFVVSNVSEAL